jgi:hypothetical protein
MLAHGRGCNVVDAHTSVDKGGTYALGCEAALSLTPGYLVPLGLSATPHFHSRQLIGGLICWTVGTAFAFGFAAALYRPIGGGSVVRVAEGQQIAAHHA